jgi:signal transduction histidine kinase
VTSAAGSPAGHLQIDALTLHELDTQEQHEHAPTGELERLRALVEASGTLLASLQVEDVLPRVLDLARQTLAADAYALWQHESAGGWRIARHHGLSDEYAREALAAIASTDNAVSLSEPLTAEDVQAAEWLTPSLRAAHAREGTRSLLAVGLHDRDRVLGTLAFYYREPHTFTQEERTTAVALANLAAACLVSAELYEAQARMAEERRLVAEASQLLSSSLDYETTLRNVAALLVPDFADWCVIELVGEGGALCRLAIAHMDPRKVQLADELAVRFRHDPNGAFGAPRAVRTGESELASDVPAAMLEAVARGDGELLEILRGLGLRSWMCVPIAARDRVLGAITFVTAESGRRYGGTDLATAESLARQVAAAVDNALLFRESERARAAAERARERLAVLADASSQLASTLDYEATLANVASLLVPRYADWCAVDVVDDRDHFRRIAVVHKDPAKAEWAARSQRLYGPVPHEPEGTARVVRSGEPALYRRVPDELLRTSTLNEEHYETLKQLGMESALVVPLTAGGRTFGALMLVSADPERLYDEDDLDFAMHLGRRAAVAVDNARLYREAQERAHAALVVEHVADGVVLVDEQGFVRLWNPAAERITGLPAAEAVGRPAAETVRPWETLAPLAASETVAPETRPVEVADRELWLSITGVAFAGGAVFAFRDLTAEQALERLKSDFVSTVSHELRTPLAAIYGAALTLQRDDVRLSEPQRSGLLEVIAGEADRLARIVNDILWASRLESGTMPTLIQACDAVELAAGTVEAARSYVPPNIELRFEAPEPTPPLAADPDKVRQVLANLVENAVKYSPDGGEIVVGVTRTDERIRFSIRDHGLGVPPEEHRRIFEKFYRLDPQLARGVGGTGLGLYICRELVERMGGRIWVESAGTGGSEFLVELPTLR